MSDEHEAVPDTLRPGDTIPAPRKQAIEERLDALENVAEDLRREVGVISRGIRELLVEFKLRPEFEVDFIARGVKKPNGSS